MYIYICIQWIRELLFTTLGCVRLARRLFLFCWCVWILRVPERVVLALRTACDGGGELQRHTRTSAAVWNMSDWFGPSDWFGSSDWIESYYIMFYNILYHMILYIYSLYIMYRLYMHYRIDFILYIIYFIYIYIIFIA